jgi:diketogulonate reductase-like aldo/keto reductase
MALANGYRSIDTAQFYGNETSVGKAVRESGISRETLFITTKVWNSEQGYETTLQAFEQSMGKLDCGIIDLYLIHWPVEGLYSQTWQALEKLYLDGSVKAIGVSNFHLYHLENLLQTCEIVPMVNQVEFHPYLTHNELRSFCRKHKIQFEAWSPLMRGQIVDIPQIRKIAGSYGKTPAQVVLRWDLQHGVVTIPKSVRRSRIIENADIFDFELSSEDMAALDALDRNRRVGPDPDNFSF